MPINLTISADSVAEFDTLLARFARSPSTAIMPEIAHTPAAQEAAAAAEPTPKPARGKKAPAKAEEPAVDPFAPAPAASEETAGEANGVAAETASPTPSATSPAAEAAADAGEVTIQQLKDAMADLLKAKSASFAMQTLEQATGCKSLTSGSPNVVEKAKDDPTIMRRTLDALVAAKTA